MPLPSLNYTDVVGFATGKLTGRSSAGTGALEQITVSTGLLLSGGNLTVASAPAGTLTGTTLNATVVTSSLTSVGTLTSLTVTNQITAGYVAGTPNYFGPAPSTLSAYAKSLHLDQIGAFNGTLSVINIGTNPAGVSLTCEGFNDSVTPGELLDATMVAHFDSAVLSTAITSCINAETYATGAFNGNEMVGMTTYCEYDGSATMPKATGLRIFGNVNGGSGAVTENRGISIDAQNISGATNIALKIANQGSGYAIQSLGGQASFVGPVIANSYAFTSEYANGNSGASITINWANGGRQSVVLNSATVAITFSNPFVGGMQLRLIQDGSGSRTVNFTGSGYYTPGGLNPTLGAGINGWDILGVYYDGTNYDVALSGSNFKAM